MMAFLQEMEESKQEKEGGGTQVKKAKKSPPFVFCGAFVGLKEHAVVLTQGSSNDRQRGS